MCVDSLVLLNGVNNYNPLYMPGLRVLTHAGSIYSLLITNRVPIHYLMWVKSIEVVLVESISRLEP